MGWPRSSASGPPSRATSRSSPTPSARTSGRRPRVTRSRCSTGSAPTRSRSTRTPAARPSPRCTSARTGTPTSCAGPRTRTPPSSRTCRSPRIPPSTRPAEPLHLRVARHAATWGPGGTVGLVVGATAPAELRAIRAVAPGLGFLVPGIGAQGGDIAPVMADGPATAAPAASGAGRGLLVNVSRGISDAALGEPADGGPRDPGERLAAAARDWASRLPVLP